MCLRMYLASRLKVHCLGSTQLLTEYIESELTAQMAKQSERK